MERIELRDIAGYLPYGLNVISLKPHSKTIGELYVEYGGMNSVQVRSNDFEDESGYILPLREINPILRPLSSLYKPILHNGKEEVPILELARIASPSKEWVLNKKEEYVEAEDINFDKWYFSFEEPSAFVLRAGYDPKIIYNQHKLFDYLHSRFIDYCGLIDAGLAISVYDLENNPYE